MFVTFCFLCTKERSCEIDFRVQMNRTYSLGSTGSGFLMASVEVLRLSTVLMTVKTEFSFTARNLP